MGNEVKRYDSMGFRDRLGGYVHWSDFDAQSAEIVRLTAEVDEQARLLGMSGERELALRATIARLEAEARGWARNVDEHAKHMFHVTKLAMGFVNAPPWDELAEETRHTYRVEAVTRLKDAAFLPPASKSVQKRIAAQKGEPYPFKEK